MASDLPAPGRASEPGPERASEPGRRVEQALVARRADLRRATEQRRLGEDRQKSQTEKARPEPNYSALHAPPLQAPCAPGARGPGQLDGGAGPVLHRLLVLELKVPHDAARQVRREVLGLHKLVQLLHLPLVPYRHRVVVHHVVEQLPPSAITRRRAEPAPRLAPEHCANPPPPARAQAGTSTPRLALAVGRMQSRPRRRGARNTPRREARLSASARPGQPWRMRLGETRRRPGP